MADNEKKRARILIVEDDAIISALLEKTLKQHGYEPLGVAIHGDDAARKIDELRPELIVMDISAAKRMNGAEAAGRIISEHDLPVLYATADPGDAPRQSRIARPYGCLMKPIRNGGLQAGVEMALGGHESETDLKEKMRLSEEKFNLFFYSNPAAMAVSTLAEGRCININNSFTRITGYDQEDTLGRTSIELEFWVRPVDRDRATGILRRRGSFRDLEFEYRHKSGRIRTGMFSSEIIHMEGETYIITAMQDVTERKKAEKDLHLEMERRKQVEEQLKELVRDLKRINTEVQDFAHIVSHDLKTPLRGVISLANWLEEDFADALGESGRKYLDKLQLRTRLMSKMIDGILEYTRAGGVEAELQDIDSDALVRKVIDDLHPPDGVHVNIEGDLPTVVYDITLLEQVFRSLIENAVIHMGKPEGRVEISHVKTGGSHEFCVRDNGQGIEKRNFERIFRIFQSLDAQPGRPSTGVGLSLVRKIVERNGGRVRVESRPGGGSAFYFSVPMGLEPVDPVTGRTALIIDDNMEFVSIVKAMLKYENFKVLSAATGQEAYDILERCDGHIHFALFDVEIPGEDALKRYDVLRRSRPDMKIILCTGFDGSETTRRLIGKGVDGLLKKPFRVSELHELIQGA